MSDMNRYGLCASCGWQSHIKIEDEEYWRCMEDTGGRGGIFLEEKLADGNYGVSRCGAFKERIPRPLKNTAFNHPNTWICESCANRIEDNKCAKDKEGYVFNAVVRKIRHPRYKYGVVQCPQYKKQEAQP